MMIRFDDHGGDAAPNAGFALPPAPRRRALAFAELVMSMALAVCIVVAATAISFGVGGDPSAPALRAGKFPAQSAAVDERPRA